MAGMSRFPILLLAAAAVLLAVFPTVACGGDDDDANAGKGSRITDPAKVPSATPMRDSTLYQITGDEVTLSGGATSKVTPTGSTPATGSTYTVAAGDLCGSIATKFGVTVDDLLKANRTVDCAAPIRLPHLARFLL